MEDQKRVGNYRSQFQRYDSMGSEGYSQVFAGHQVENPNNQVAIKLISLRKSTQKEVMNQINCMLSLRSQGTMNILAVEKIKFGKLKQEHYAIVTQKMDGSLRDLLQQKGKLPEKQAIKWGSKIIECYKYLYKASIINRNLKPENVLYRKCGDQIIFKIGDFGFSRSSKILINKGTVCQISQQQANQGAQSEKTDVYAFGCMLFQFLIGAEKVPMEFSRIILRSGQMNKVDVEKLLSDLGISKMMIQLVKGCLMQEQTDRLGWKDIFSDPIFQKFEKQKEVQGLQPQKVQIRSNKLRITPDITTLAWKEKRYRQGDLNKNFCIYQDEIDSFEWLCSAQDLSSVGECVFTIKAIEVTKGQWFGKQVSSIHVGVMESSKKGEQKKDTLNHCVFLSILFQAIYRPNKEQTKQEGIDFPCQSFLPSLPCLIQCYVNRNQNTIIWHYNGKDQAKSIMPESWKDGRKICAIVQIWIKDDCVQFM